MVIADTQNACIREVDVAGIIDTIAGTGAPVLDHPRQLAMDATGNVYIADTDNERVRKLDTSGWITTVAGTGTGGYNGDGIPATTAQLNEPRSVCVAPSGNLYIADYNNYRIRKVDRQGIISTWVGGGRGYTVDGMPATDAFISPPHAIAMDSRRTLYIGQTPHAGECYPVSKVEVHSLGEPHEVLFDSPRGDFTKLRQNPDLTFTRTLKDGTEIHFDQRGLHVKTVDLNGNTTLYGYDNEDRLKTITDPMDQITRFEYENNGRLSRIIDPAGRETRFEVDEVGDLRAVFDPEGAETRFGYQDHLLTSSTDPQGYSTDYVYDPAYGRVSEVDYPTGEIRSFTHSDIQGLINDLPPGVGTRQNPAPIVRSEEITDSFTDGEQKTRTFRTNPFGHIIDRLAFPRKDV